MKIKRKRDFSKYVDNGHTGIVEICDGELYRLCVGVEYYENGNCHREDGPAIERLNGTNTYYLNNARYSSEENWKIAVGTLRKLKKV